MKIYIKFVAIVILVSMALIISAKEMTPNIKFRKSNRAFVVSCYLDEPKFRRAYEYDVMTFEANSILMENNNALHNISFEISRREVGSMIYAPFSDDVLEISNQMRVGREDLPNDPSVPLGDGVLLLVLFAIVWVGYKIYE